MYAHWIAILITIVLWTFCFWVASMRRSLRSWLCARISWQHLNFSIRRACCINNLFFLQVNNSSFSVIIWAMDCWILKDYDMAYNFLPCNRNQTYLLPPSLTDWLPEDHLAWFVLDAVEQIDLSQFYKKYRTDGVGNSAFNPSMMVGLLIYSYCTGERSSRRIEKHCQTDVAYRVITANLSPDHSTISRFRKNNESYLKGLFLEILRLCSEAGLVKLGNVSLDGTKIKSNASLAARSRMLAALTSLWGEELRPAKVSGRWYALRIMFWSCGEVERPAGIDRKAVFWQFEVKFCLISKQNTINILKINKGCMRTRELSHLDQTAIGPNRWIRKTLCNRLNSSGIRNVRERDGDCTPFFSLTFFMGIGKVRR